MASLIPSDGIRLLQRAIALPGVLIVPAYVAQDLASLRRAHSDDSAFAAAVLAVAKEISLARKSPTKHGTDIGFEISGWRRSKFASRPKGAAHLRLVFRATNAEGIHVLAFGERQLPQSIYRTAKERL
jgi:hypothetical protein